MIETRIPNYQDLMPLVLEACRHEDKRISVVVEEISNQLGLTEEERDLRLPSGKQTLITNRVHWARSYLKHAGLVRNPQRGWVSITQRGIDAVASGKTIDNSYLSKFEDFQLFKDRSSTIDPDNTSEALTTDTETPDDVIMAGYQKMRAVLKADLLERTINNTPDFFEEILIELFLAMGYGSALGNSGRKLGKTGDRGVDGVIDQDPLGVDQIYIQAKRYDLSNKVGPHEIRDFFGALNIRRASKGIFVTTSDFTSEAVRTATDLGTRIVLINGSQLASLMIDNGIGVSHRQTIELYELDEEYFNS